MNLFIKAQKTGITFRYNAGHFSGFYAQKHAKRCKSSNNSHNSLYCSASLLLCGIDNIPSPGAVNFTATIAGTCTGAPADAIGGGGGLTLYNSTGASAVFRDRA